MIIRMVLTAFMPGCAVYAWQQQQRAAYCLLLLALAGRAGQFHAARVDSQCSGRRSLY
eukprot:COSAG06_NODE_6237_length_3024_cov_1.304615_2_plen_58_part_00